MRALLIVDDHASALETLAFVFSSRGYRTLTAPNGQRALEIAEQELPRWSISTCPGSMASRRAVAFEKSVHVAVVRCQSG